MAASNVSLKFPRDRRIKQGRDFQRIKTQGRRLVHGSLIINWVELPPGSASRLGVITSRKVGAAVARSRARRLMRESFRRHQLELRQPIDLIVVARPSMAGKGFAEVENDYLTALRRARLLITTE
jgi:ribonuclease P protein component